jgi:putative SOS response-associated peptidase YedK
MPVILNPADYDAWLDPANDDVEELQSLLVPFSGKMMKARPVSTYVNNARD